MKLFKHEIRKKDYNTRVITTNTSIGREALLNVRYINSGFNWKAGQFNTVAVYHIMKSNAIEELVQLTNLQNLKNPK